MSAVDGDGDNRAIRDGILIGYWDFWLRHVAEWPIQSGGKAEVAAALTKAAEMTRRSP